MGSNGMAWHLDISSERIQLNILKDLFLVQPKRGWLQLNLNDYRLSLRKRNEAFLNWDEIFIAILRCILTATVIARGSEEKSNLSRNNKKSESCRVFSFTSAIIIGFLSVIELQRGERLGLKCCRREILRMFTEPQSKLLSSRGARIADKIRTKFLPKYWINDTFYELTFQEL